MRAAVTQLNFSPPYGGGRDVFKRAVFRAKNCPLASISGVPQLGKYSKYTVGVVFYVNCAHKNSVVTRGPLATKIIAVIAGGLRHDLSKSIASAEARR